MCTPQEDPTLSAWEQEFSNQMDEMLSHLLNEYVAAGELQAVVLSQDIASKYNTSQLATFEYDEEKDKAIYRVGPKEFAEHHHTLPEIQIASMIPFMEAYRDGQELPKLRDIISSGVKIIRKEKNPILTQISFLESYIFRQKSNVLLIDPSKGSIYRALEEDRNVYYVMTSRDPKWEVELQDLFIPKFQARKLHFQRYSELIPLEDCVVYHGANGFKHIFQPNSFALEPNPYSDINKEMGSAIISAGRSVKFYYEILKPDGLKRNMEYEFLHHPEHFRIDPHTLNYLHIVKGDSFFLSTTVNPKHLGFTMATNTKSATVSEMFCYEDMPAYRDYEGERISYDETYLYDVEIPCTVPSRRFYARRKAREMGLTLKQYVEFGKFVAHPYSLHYHEHDWNVRNQLVIHSSHAMSSNAIYDELTSHHKGPVEEKAVIFIVNDFAGKKITPLESFGSTYPVDLYVDVEKKNWRYPDLRPWINKKGMVFGSRRIMKMNVHLLCYFCVPYLRPVDFYGKEEKLGEPEMAYIEDDSIPELTAIHLKEEKVVIPLETQVRNIFLENNRAYFFHEIETRLVEESSRKVWRILMTLPEIHCQLQGINYHEDIWSLRQVTWHQLDHGRNGLSCYPDSTSLKKDIIDGVTEFEDDNNVDVTPQVKYLEIQGIELIGVKRENEVTKRTFRPIVSS